MLCETVDLPIGKGLTLSIQQNKNSTLRMAHAYLVKADGRVKGIYQVNSAETLAEIILKAVVSENEKGRSQ